MSAPAPSATFVNRLQIRLPIGPSAANTAGPSADWTINSKYCRSLCRLGPSAVNTAGPSADQLQIPRVPLPIGSSTVNTAGPLCRLGHQPQIPPAPLPIGPSAVNTVGPSAELFLAHERAQVHHVSHKVRNMPDFLLAESPTMLCSRRVIVAKTMHRVNLPPLAKFIIAKTGHLRPKGHRAAQYKYRVP